MAISIVINDESYQPRHITDKEFDALVLQAGDLAAVIDFHADWCGPCRYIAPYIAKLCAEYKNHLLVCKMNVDDNKLIPERYGVDSFPRLLSFHKGEKLGEKRGSDSYSGIRQFFVDLLATVAPSVNPCANAEAEQAFTVAVDVIEKEYKTAKTPLRNKFDAIYEPAQEAYEIEVKAAGAVLKAGTITQEEYDNRVKAAKTAFKAAVDQPWQLFNEAAEPIKQKREADIRQATTAFLLACSTSMA